MIRVSVDASTGPAFARLLERQGAFVVERTARRVAARAQQLAAQAADNTYATRSPERRHAGAARYKFGFRGEVRGSGSRTVVSLRNRAPHANILEKGARPGYEIHGNPLLAFPAADLLASGTRAVNAFGRPTSRGTGKKARNTVLPKVTHPGIAGSHIMENAMRQAWAEEGVRLGPMRQ